MQQSLRNPKRDGLIYMYFWQGLFPHLQYCFTTPQSLNRNLTQALEREDGCTYQSSVYQAYCLKYFTVNVSKFLCILYSIMHMWFVISAGNITQLHRAFMTRSICCKLIISQSQHPHAKKAQELTTSRGVAVQ